MPQRGASWIRGASPGWTSVTSMSASSIAAATSAHKPGAAIVVDDAPWLFIVHDQNPRGLAKKVKNFKPAQNWYQDFTQILIE